PRSTNFSAQFLVNITEYLEGYVTDYAEVIRVSVPLEEPAGRSGIVLVLGKQAMLELFTPHELVGSMQQVIESPGLIALEAGTASLIFDSAEAAIGQRITLGAPGVFSAAAGFEAGQPAEFEVAAVYTLPQPSTNSMRWHAIAGD